MNLLVVISHYSGEAILVAPEDKLFFELCAGLGYFLVTIALLLLGSMQGSWHGKSNPRVLHFQKPWVLRLGVGMFSLFLLAIVLYFALDAVNSLGVWEVWLFYIPSCLTLAVFFAYMAGPQDISIDLETRICQETKGWAFRPQKRSLPLTDASSVCICSGGETYYVFLMVGSGQQPWFLLARPERKSSAKSYAQAIADKLHLPVKETTLKEIRKLS